ncbi:MAG: glycosyltransferase family 9 protein [Candidatus Omnitrophica bacterium]|nr:glycosyltransferase family 9 protein [Candidatus Omnitrophota bacterium]
MRWGPQGSAGEPKTPAASSGLQATGRRFLVIGPSNIGDAILMSPVVAALHRHDPSAHLALIVGSRARALFIEDPRVHTLTDLDQFDALAGRLKLALVLWRYHPHLVVDLRHTLYPLLLKPLRAWRYLLQPPRAVPHMRDRHLWKLRIQAPEIRVQDPGLQRASAAAADGGSVWCGPKERAHVDGLWRRWRLEDAQRTVVVICPGARSHIKRWTAEGIARVADRLIQERGVTVIFSGEPDEEPIVESIVELMDHRAHSAVGLTTIRQLGALMQRARVVITNDSASLHLASAVGVPTVAVFGPTDAAKYGPTADPSRTIRRRLFCSPCELSLCPLNHECMRFIPPDEVYEAAVTFLEQRG